MAAARAAQRAALNRTESSFHPVPPAPPPSSASGTTASPAAAARPHAQDHPHDRESKVNKCGLRSLTGRGRRGGSRHLYPTLAQQVLLLLDVLLRLGPGRRFGAQAPRHQPGASSACPRGQGPPPAPGSPVPGPDGGLGNNGDDSGHPFQRPRGPGPVQNGHQDHPPKQPVPAVITSHPVIVAQAARVCAKLPGCRHPDAAARRGARAPMPRSGRIRANQDQLVEIGSRRRRARRRLAGAPGPIRRAKSGRAAPAAPAVPCRPGGG